MAQRNSFMGLDGFVWFMGVVESRDDPLRLGRVQARIFGWHTDNKAEIPTADLPWSQPLFPPNAANLTSTPKEGDYIIGFFTDGEGAQFPVFLGVLPGIPENTPPDSKGFADPRPQAQRDGAPTKPFSRALFDKGINLRTDDKDRYPRKRHWNQPTTSRLARHEDLANTVYQFRKTNWIKADSTSGSSWKEPYPAYNAQYPFDSVLETESGHILEFDDTASNERIMLTHRTGTTTEMYPSGTKLDKIVKDNYTIVHGSDFCYVKGKTEVTVENVAKIRIKGKTTIEIDGDFDLRVAGDMNVAVGKKLNIQTESDVNYNIGGNVNEVVSGYGLHKFGAEYAVDAPRIDLNSGVASGTPRVSLTKPNAYVNPDEVAPLPEQVKTINYTAAEAPNAPLPANVAIITPVPTPTEPVVTEQPPTANVESKCFTLPMLQATGKGPNLQTYVDAFNKACETYAINTVLRKSHFLAQCSHESGGFTIIEENLNYSAEGLMKIFPKYFPDSATASAYARQPEKIANKVYANRMANGPESSGDGWKYHGRGLIQLTGKENYTRFANAMKMSLDDAVAYCSTPEGAAMSAVWFWNSRGINAQADADDITAVTRKVNGGTIGLDDRKARYEKTKPVVEKESK